MQTGKCTKQGECGKECKWTGEETQKEVKKKKINDGFPGFACNLEQAQ